MARPTRSHAILFVAPLLCGALLAGCAANTPDSSFPVRPHDIDVSRIDPCALLVSETRTALGVRDGESSRNTLDGGVESRNCGWDNFDTGTSYSVQIVGISAEAAVGGGRSIENVAGYGAVQQIETPGSAPSCALVVDVDDMQTMRVLVLSTHYVDGRPRPIDDVCGEVLHVATDVVAHARRLAP